MNSIKIESGAIKLAINEDVNRVVSFNPTNVSFVEKLYSVSDEIKEKENEFRKELNQAEKVKEEKQRNLATIAVYKNMLNFVKRKIDELFGEGTSDKILNGEDDIDMLYQFLEGIMPYVQEIRSRAIAKYTTSKAALKPSKVME